MLDPVSGFGYKPRILDIDLNLTHDDTENDDIGVPFLSPIWTTTRTKFPTNYMC